MEGCRLERWGLLFWAGDALSAYDQKQAFMFCRAFKAEKCV